MAKKISELTDLNATPASDDKLIILDTSASQTKRVDYNDFIGTTLLITMFQGCLQRPKFEYNDTTSILISSAWYEHNGTAQQILYWNAQLTYTFGSGGSNANSDDLGASEWHYLYIDDSELSGAEMVAGEFINTTTAPSWSEAKHGWYNGNDKCIGAFLTNASSQIIEFWHDGGEYFSYANSIEDRAYAVVASGFNAYTLTLPDFGEDTPGEVVFVIADASGNSTAYWRKTGSSATTGINVGVSASTYYGSYNGNSVKIFTDSSQQIDVNITPSGAFAMHTSGYYFPRGM